MACMMIFDYFLMASKGLSYLLVKFINGILGFSTLCIIIDSWSKFSLPSFLQPISLINKNIFLHLGQISMSVYLLHVICGSITRNILAQFGVLDPNIQFTLGLLISAIGPVLFHRTFRKNRLFLYSIGEAK